MGLMETGLIFLGLAVTTMAPGNIPVLYKNVEIIHILFSRPQIRRVSEVTGEQLPEIGIGNAVHYEIRIGSDTAKTAAVLMSFSQPVKPQINVKITKAVCSSSKPAHNSLYNSLFLGDFTSRGNNK